MGPNSLSTNSSNEDLSTKALLEHPILTNFTVYQIVMPLLMALVIVLNASVVVSSGLILTKNRPQPRSTYLILGNMALADLIRGVAWVYGWVDQASAYSSHVSCAVHEGVVSSSSLASVLSVGLVAFDRYLYIMHGLKYKTWLTTRRVHYLMIGVWVLGCAVGFLPLMGWHSDVYDGRRCWFLVIAPPGLILLTVTVAFTPIVTTVIVYSIILCRALKTVSELREENAQNSLRKFKGGDSRHGSSTSVTSPSNPNKWKAIKVVVFTTGCYVMTRFPYMLLAYINVAGCGGSKSRNCDLLKVVMATPGPLALLAFLNSLLNPVIYAWWHKGFRESLGKFFKRVMPENVAPNHNA